MKNIRRHVMRSRVNSVWYCMNNRSVDKKITLKKKTKEEKSET